MKCVVRRIVFPWRRSTRSFSHIWWRAWGSRPVVGSSRKMRSGSFTSARARMSRRFIPPESSWMRLAARDSSAANSRSAGRRSPMRSALKPK
jgi:hypothetical protein